MSSMVYSPESAFSLPALTEATPVDSARVPANAGQLRRIGHDADRGDEVVLRGDMEDEHRVRGAVEHRQCRRVAACLDIPDGRAGREGGQAEQPGDAVRAVDRTARCGRLSGENDVRRTASSARPRA